jgi:hypothetical protein
MIGVRVRGSRGALGGHLHYIPRCHNRGGKAVIPYKE